MADANTATSADRRRHDVVFNAITRALRDADLFVAITEREAITAAVLNALAADEPQSGAHAQGYAEAVARLRDDERYRYWWSASPESVRPTEPIRGHLADYLETVGPDGPDVTRPGAGLSIRGLTVDLVQPDRERAQDGPVEVTGSPDPEWLALLDLGRGGGEDGASAICDAYSRGIRVGLERAAAVCAPAPSLDDRDPGLARALGAATSLPRSELLPEVRRLVTQFANRGIAVGQLTVDLTPADQTRAQAVHDQLAAARPGEVFDFEQRPGQRVLVVVARSYAVEPPKTATTSGWRPDADRQPIYEEALASGLSAYEASEEAWPADGGVPWKQRPGYEWQPVTTVEQHNNAEVDHG